MQKKGIAILLVMSLFLTGVSLTSSGRSKVKLETEPPYHTINKTSVLETQLEENLAIWDSDAEVSLLVRFKDEPSLEKEVILNEMGFDVFAKFHVVPALGLKGPARAVMDLLAHPSIVRIENDSAVELFMEQSLRTINATKVWDTRIIEDGVHYRDEQIDGSGITVVVLDTGIDADHPDLDYGDKTILNLKADMPGGPWHERTNTDTSYGHGTHCAGTVAGNGDASAGARRGVAPGANLIGLSVGDIGIALTNVVGGLEWVYDNSKPNSNPHNIRVVSNSWGTSGKKWDPQDTISQICYKLAEENNVVNIFAAGNDGENNHDGHEITTSPYANTPINIAVAAFSRDGNGMAYFSSRGQSDLLETWPDVGAPGVKIWSAHARKTAISAIDKMRGDNPNPYYLAISGTSMATPHVSGLAALMFQACPSLGMSEEREDGSGTEDYGLEWESAAETRIHEVEEVLELSARFLASGEGVPEMDESVTGTNGRKMDFAQGYGLIQANIAVGICLTLQKLRDLYPDREINVKDAYEIFIDEGILYEETLEEFSREFTASWEGEYSRWNDIQQSGLLDTQNQTKYIYVPNSTTHIKFAMTYQVTSLEDLSAGDLSYTIDIGADGRNNYVGALGFQMQGHKELDVEVSGDKVGTIWKIDIVGRGLKVPITAFNPDRSYVEIRVEYDASFTIRGPTTGENDTAPPFPLLRSSYGPFMANFYPKDEMAKQDPPDAIPSRTEVFVYNLDRVDFPTKEASVKKEKGNWWPYILLAAALLAVSALLARKKLLKKGIQKDRKDKMD